MRSKREKDSKVCVYEWNEVKKGFDLKSTEGSDTAASVVLLNRRVTKLPNGDKQIHYDMLTDLKVASKPAAAPVKV